MKRKAVCFVDDDGDEVRRFREFMRDHYIVGAGTTLVKALDELHEQRVGKPDLFLLDLYYGPETSAAMREEIATLDEQLSAREAEMRELLDRAGQSQQGGFNLADEVQRTHPGVPCVFFSRKAFLEDALRAQDRGLPVLQKPDPDANDGDAAKSARYDSAFKRHAVHIARSLDRKITLNTWWVRNRQKVESFAMGFFFFLLKVGWDFWKGDAHVLAALIWFVSLGLFVVAGYGLFFKR